MLGRFTEQQISDAELRSKFDGYRNVMKGLTPCQIIEFVGSPDDIHKPNPGYEIKREVAREIFDIRSELRILEEGDDKSMPSKATTPYDSEGNADHYKKGEIETIDYLKSRATPEEFQGFLRLTALRYLDRYSGKDTKELNIRKAKWYLNKLHEELKVEKD